MKYARSINDVVLEVFIPPTGFEITDCFTPEVVLMFEVCADNVEAGWIRDSNSQFVEPPKVENVIS